MLWLVWEHFREGGWGMWFIATWFAAAVAILAVRTVRLARASVDADALFAAVDRALAAGDPDLAAAVCARCDTPLARVALAALRRWDAPAEHLRATVYEASLCETSALTRTSPYLKTLANLGTLTGLLATVTGIGGGFGSAAYCGGRFIDPGCKAQLLAAAIGEAMNCSAFGLLVGLVCIAGYGMLRAAEDALVADLDAGSLQIVRLIESSRVSVDHPDGANGPYRSRGAP